MTIGGDRVGTDAGKYTATFPPKSNYQWWDGTTEAKEVQWTITSVIVPIPTQKGSLTYNGAAQTPEWDNFDQENSSVSVTAQTNAGTHTATFTLLNGMEDLKLRDLYCTADGDLTFTSNGLDELTITQAEK